MADFWREKRTASEYFVGTSNYRTTSTGRLFGFFRIRGVPIEDVLDVGSLMAVLQRMLIRLKPGKTFAMSSLHTVTHMKCFDLAESLVIVANPLLFFRHRKQSATFTIFTESIAKSMENRSFVAPFSNKFNKNLYSGSLLRSQLPISVGGARTITIKSSKVATKVKRRNLQP